MSKQGSIQRIWNGHWANSPSAVAATLGERFTLEAFRKICAFVNKVDSSILETGCGTGRFCTLFAKEYPRAKVIGIDLSPSALEIAREMKLALGYNNLMFGDANLFQLPFRDDNFDIVFSEGVLQHFSMDGSPTYLDALQEAIRVTKPGGRVIISVVNWYCFPHTMYKWLLKRRKIPYEYGYEKSFRRNELVRLLKEHGLRSVESSGYYASYGFYRLRNREGSRYSRLFDTVGALIDKIDNGWISRYFGFEIVAAGVK